MLNSDWSQSPRPSFGRTETDPDDPFEREWIREKWSMAFARKYAHMYRKDEPMPWELAWPYRTRRPRCVVDTCRKPVVVLNEHRVVSDSCLSHITNLDLAPFGYEVRACSKKGRPYLDGRPRIFPITKGRRAKFRAMTADRSDLVRVARASKIREDIRKQRVARARTKPVDI